MTTTRTSSTLGPWHIEGVAAPIYGSDGRLMASGVGIGSGSTHIATVQGQHAEAHARLIASAPALLEMVRNLASLASVRGRLDDYTALLDDARALLATVEGGQP